MWELLASVGMLAIEASYVPQILRLWRLKRADEVSFLFPGLNFVGRLLVAIYSFQQGQAVLALGFLVGMVLRLTLLCQVVWYRRVRPAPSPPGRHVPGLPAVTAVAVGLDGPSNG